MLKRRLSEVVLGALLLFVGSLAQATPVTLWASTSWGWQSPGIASLQAAGVLQLPDQAVFTTNSGLNLQGSISVTTPPRIRGVNLAKASFANPSRGSSIWTITANDQSYQDLWIVLAGHDITGDKNGPNGNRFYRTPKAGLLVDSSDSNWAVVRPTGSPVSYLAYRVGDLAQGQSFQLPIQYRVAQGLYKQGRKFLFPQYRVAFLSLAVPEPSTLVLLLGAGIAFVASRRKPC